MKNDLITILGPTATGKTKLAVQLAEYFNCLLYTSDAADERSSVDLGGRRIIKKKNKAALLGVLITNRIN